MLLTPPLHQAARSAADNWIKQQNGADEYPRGPAWEQGLPGQKQELLLPSHKPSLRQGYLHVSSLLDSPRAQWAMPAVVAASRGHYGKGPHKIK